jgi:4-hydroxy-3-methylbut-2-enyl diphosphate reductase
MRDITGSPPVRRIVLAQPRGFCAGVIRAISIVELALQKAKAPVYVRHEIVHNEHVVGDLKAKGARFVDEIDEIPDGALTIFSAHGVGQSVIDEAQRRSLPVIDATCPLVAKVHTQGKRYLAQGRTLILIGHAGHAETEGTIGQMPAPVHLVQTEADVDALPIPAETPVAYITQTTLSIDDTRGIISAIERRFADVLGPNTSDICYATQNRQQAVRALSEIADVILVVGSRTSSNSNRLREIAEEAGKPSYLVADGTEVAPEWVANAQVIGLTAGASAPESMVQHVISRIQSLGPAEVTNLPGIEENVEFRLPAELQSL